MEIRIIIIALIIVTLIILLVSAGREVDVNTVANSMGCHQPDLSRCHNPAHFLVMTPCRSLLTDRRFIHKTSDGNGRSLLVSS